MSELKANPWVAFLIDLLVLFVNLIKIWTWTVFRYLFKTKKSVNHEIVLITGSAKGLGNYCVNLSKILQYLSFNYLILLTGRQLAIEFAKLGSVLVLIDSDDQENKKTVDLIKSKGLNHKKVFAYHCDLRFLLLSILFTVYFNSSHLFISYLRSRTEIHTVSDCIRKDVGNVTIIVNNAGISHFKSFVECDENSFIETLQVNLFSSYWILKEFLPSMLSKNHGHIISISNSAGSIIIHLFIRHYQNFKNNSSQVLKQLPASNETSVLLHKHVCLINTGKCLYRLKISGHKLFSKKILLVKKNDNLYK